jgi:putative NADPH-quinone reductase
LIGCACCYYHQGGYTRFLPVLARGVTFQAWVADIYAVNSFHFGGEAMTRHIAIIQGHPDPKGGHYGHALADAYAKGAKAAGHKVSRIEVAALDFPLLRSFKEFESGEVVDDLMSARQAIERADHLVILYPLWLGTMPALLKAFFEQLFKPGFAFDYLEGGRWRKRLTGRSARVVITMGMPAFAYRWYFGAHSLKSLERNILKFVGIKPVRESLIGMVEGSAGHREKWLAKMEVLGRKGI